MSDDKPPPFTSVIDEPAPATAGKLPPDPEFAAGGTAGADEDERPENARNSGAQKEEGIPAFAITWHGDDDTSTMEEWLVEEMLYQAGVGLMAGQWGTFKTFAISDLAGSVMTKTPFAGHPVHRQGGVLFIAAEGQSQLKIRIIGLAMGKVANVETPEDAISIDPNKMPIAWVKSSPRLSDPESAKELRTLINHIAREMEDRFSLPLALVIIDALMPAAQFKEANDATEARRVMDMLAGLGHEFNLLILPVDHFGKDVSTGTRNSSSKEDAADTILALLGERSIEGRLDNPRMAIRKVKGGGKQGTVIPFTPREIIVGETDGGRPIKTMIIDWQIGDRASAGAAVKIKKPGWPKSLIIFRRAMLKAMEREIKIKPFAERKAVIAAPDGATRDEYMKIYLTNNEDPKKARAARLKAYGRDVLRAISGNLICGREIDGQTFYWFMDVGNDGHD